ncbi:MAG: DNA-directed RNA polymerase subunit beta' [Candidatus Electryonea clarkiae]|nr:DNA-directed RNA polymerase subunit beta' [Candidatus Electryonea clarkiae]MDP8288927.1 DNA-directed RNA polymerase subunit beta' [Candidatus Electryonea clarkiae]
MLTTGRKQEYESRNFKQISINLASPEMILAKSYGEVTKPETINYRSYKPEKDGLFSEKIFGPTKDWECHCNKYRGIRYKGIICDRCGVEVTRKEVRRKRVGHIKLAIPVVHIWFFKSMPSKIGYLLGMPVRELEKVIYYENYIITQPGNSGLKYMQPISESEYLELMEVHGPTNAQLPEDSSERFIALTGGLAIRDLLRRIDIEELSNILRRAMREETSIQRKQDAIKRLRVVEAFRESTAKDPTRPEWMILSVVPVIPPDLRPLVPLEGGRFATSDLNDLYRRVIIRNNRLKRLLEIKAPEVILRNEKRMLQESVDSLFDNGRRSVAVRSEGNRPLKSLSDNLKGKQGRFRQNLLGKRVDYSGRSVIVVGPDLQLHECGLPKDMAIELFKPFVIRKLIEQEYAKTVKSAKRMVERREEIVWGILEEILENHPVLLNRAPTLHRLGIQAFQPLLIEGKAIKLHPLVCAAFNADFDGDQMAVHVPLSYEAQLESRLLMLASQNILHPANGRPITVPSQDMVLGCYYLTKQKPGVKGEGMFFSSQDEVVVAHNHDAVSIHAQIFVRIKDEYTETTPGRVLFNQIVPESVRIDTYYNELLSKRRLEEIIADCHRRVGNAETAQFLDKLKDLGFSFSTKGGISVGLNDVRIPKEKAGMLDKSQKEVDEIQHQYEMGIITDGERYNKIIDIWTHTTANVAEAMFRNIKADENGFNPIFMMADSGARGSKDQIRQLAGMRGLMAKPQKTMTGGKGEIIESPITANFKEGLSVLEYFISTHGARKGLADTALKTADAGYLTRRLVDVAQDVIVVEKDCRTIRGITVEAQKEGEEVTEQLFERILGRVTADAVVHPVTNELVLEQNVLVGHEEAERIAGSGIAKVKIRSVLTCETEGGVCSRCYGINLANGQMVDRGEAVGVIAAQSIGEPGTQLTLRTFHIGGTAALIAAESKVVAKGDGTVVFENIHFIERKGEKGDKDVIDGKNLITIRRNGTVRLVDDNNRVIARYSVPYGATLFCRDGQQVHGPNPEHSNPKKREATLLFQWDPHSMSILATESGTVKYQDIKEDITMREEVDEITGMKQMVIIEAPGQRKLNPNVILVGENKEKLGNYMLPTGSHLSVDDGAYVKAGDPLVKIPRASSKTKDITGGLPRVAELFEARRPKSPAVVTEVDGLVRFGKLKRGYREVAILPVDPNLKTDAEGEKENEEFIYQVPYGKYILVHEGEFVTAGERLCEGSVTPQDILNVLGPAKVQEYLLNEIQDVYRLQGVRIADKHIEVIVRQMMQRVRVENPGDTRFLEGDHVDIHRLNRANRAIQSKVVIETAGDSRFEENEPIDRTEFNREVRRVRKLELQQPVARPTAPALYQPLLLGITQASLSTESFISAASFQETTRVLTEAAIERKTDELRGLKENVIMGQLIPAGTGLSRYGKMRVANREEEERKKLEKEQADWLDLEAKRAREESTEYVEDIEEEVEIELEPSIKEEKEETIIIPDHIQTIGDAAPVVEPPRDTSEDSEA